MRKMILALLASMAVIAALPATAGPALQAFEPDSLSRIVEQQKGKPFVLVVWSLDCVYCQHSMKALAEEKRRNKDLTVVTISTDPASDPEAVALMQKRLASFGMTRNAWAYGEAPSEHLRFAIDPKWRGEKPRSYWYNAQGERTAYSGVLTSAMIATLSSR